MAYKEDKKGLDPSDFKLTALKKDMGVNEGLRILTGGKDVCMGGVNMNLDNFIEERVFKHF